jgi:hypothetical protein
MHPYKIHDIACFYETDFSRRQLSWHSNKKKKQLLKPQ